MGGGKYGEGLILDKWAGLPSQLRPTWNLKARDGGSVAVDIDRRLRDAHAEDIENSDVWQFTALRRDWGRDSRDSDIIMKVMW